MSKIALVQPKLIQGLHEGDLGLAYLSAHLQKAHETRTFDAGSTIFREKDAPTSLVDGISTYNPDQVLVKVWGFDYDATAQLISQLRKRINANYVIGGPTVTLRPQKSMELTGADIGVVGDGIPTVDDALVRNTSARGIAYRRNGTIVVNGRTPFNPQNWPTPDLSSMDTKTFPYFSLVSSVGCAHSKCSFCIQKDLFNKIAYRSVDKIIGDIRTITQQYGARTIFFFDDNFLNNPQRLQEITRAMDDAGLDQKIKIGFEARADDVIRAEEYIRQACHRIDGIDIGAESFLERQLNDWTKGTTPEDNVRAFNIILSNGINPRLYLILADQKTDMVEIEAIAKFYQEHPEYILFGGGFSILQNYEETDQKYPPYVHAFYRALAPLAVCSRMNFFFGDTRDKIVAARSVEQLKYLPVRKTMERCFNGIVDLVRQVKDGKLSEDAAVEKSKLFLEGITISLHIGGR